MKKIYFVIFPIIMLVILLISMYFIDIPSPSRLITEEYKLILQ